MRERIARLAAVTLGIALVLLAALFAQRRNAPGSGPTLRDAPAAPGASTVDSVPAPDVAGAEAATVDPALVLRGRAAFDELGCTRCHAFEGRGNPRSSLDGVGARRTSDGIRAFILAEGEATAVLRASVVRAKERYRALPEEEIRALVAYLSAGGGG